MANPPSVLMVELLMSADRVITAAADLPAGGAPGEWPPATIIGHLSVVDTEVWAPRIDRMVAARSAGAIPPRFAWWEPDAQSTVEAFAGVGIDEASAGLLATRTAILHRLRELAPDDWSATAEHDDFGTIDIQGLVMLILGHDEEHRASLLFREE